MPELELMPEYTCVGNEAFDFSMAVVFLTIALSLLLRHPLSSPSFSTQWYVQPRQHRDCNPLLVLRDEEVADNIGLHYDLFVVK
ncbi:hypothetical protein Pcinc_035272 [Petrolisthes cinctipes]|uniref:Uncharacterized protein n=1 Tax=Petrolisthes cinctipes TaxID=88211 RepID=A0AAE1BWU4_PETCI|nr:hypothetical protein Pcinc_035272 [Petrolisthes cinctipes]